MANAITNLEVIPGMVQGGNGRNNMFSLVDVVCHIHQASPVGFPAKVDNNLVATSDIVPVVAIISCSLSVYHLHHSTVISLCWLPNRGGIF